MTTLLEKPICDRHCSVCEGLDHHWTMECDDDDEPIMVCKHCDVTRPVADEDFEIGDNEAGDDLAKCPTCCGSGTVNPLTAPSNFVCIGTTPCPTCEGFGAI